jgi:response regulator RpfG family c-di-GMP phosphodiesterase
VLVVDAEFPGSISSRKLVIETAKFNVITAYSGLEAIETLERFPRVDAVVVNAEEHETPCAEVVKRLKAIVPDIQIIASSAGGYDDCGAHFSVSKFDPAALLERLRSMFPGATARIEEIEKKLAKES